METKNDNLKTDINRLVWMIIFFLVACALAIMEWQERELPLMGWFLAAGVWSAICGIGYSVCDWLLQAGSKSSSASNSTKVTTLTSGVGADESVEINGDN
jgi:hypothetical protein